jgi:N-acylglucosamine-6-phosphate 2-epimerase
MDLLERLRGGLIVSVQAWPGSALDDAFVTAAMARAAQEGGAVAVRVAGAEHLRAVRTRIELPVVGLVKRRYPGFEPYITPTLMEVREALDGGAELVAFDATARRRPGDTQLGALIEAILAAGRVAFADCATLADARRACAMGAQLVATTLCGYTAETKDRALPALELVRELAQLDAFVVCEGGVRRPADLRAALDAGADAVVVGSAITSVDWLVREFAGSADRVP